MCVCVCVCVYDKKFGKSSDVSDLVTDRSASVAKTGEVSSTSNHIILRTIVKCT